MGLSKQKRELTKRGSIKNHVFQGSDTGFRLFKSMGEEIIVHFDPDVDGVVAGLLVCRFLVKHGKRFQWYINSHRSHDWGLSDDKVLCKDVIAVDFLISREKIQELCDLGVKIISMDHHENCKEPIYCQSNTGHKFEDGIRCGEGVVINNQYPVEDEDSRYLSGAGVVFETLISWDSSFDTEENRALVGITLLSDIRDIENELAEGYLYHTYSHKYKGYLKYLIDNTMGDRDYGFGLPKMDRSYVDYKFSPAINAALRYNYQEEVVNFMMGRCPLNLDYRDWQKKLIAKIREDVKVVEFNHIKVCYFNEDGFSAVEKDVLSSFVGLAASTYLDGEKSVICYLISDNKVKRASFRGRYNGLKYNESLSSILEGRGHGSAFGIIGLMPNKKLFTEVDRICGELEESCGYEQKLQRVVNLSFFVNGKAFNVAEDNMYKLSQNQTKLYYVGHGVVIKRKGANYTEYEVDGVPVMYFGLPIKDIYNNMPLITPTLERGIVKFYFD